MKNKVIESSHDHIIPVGTEVALISTGGFGPGSTSHVNVAEAKTGNTIVDLENTEVRFDTDLGNNKIQLTGFGRSGRNWYRLSFVLG